MFAVPCPLHHGFRLVSERGPYGYERTQKTQKPVEAGVCQEPVCTSDPPAKLAWRGIRQKCPGTSLHSNVRAAFLHHLLVTQKLTQQEFHGIGRFMKESLRVYRDLLRAARSFPVQPVARKLKSNIKEVSGVFLDERDPDKVCGLHEDGRAALRVIAFLKGLPQVNPW